MLRRGGNLQEHLANRLELNLGAAAFWRPPWLHALQLWGPLLRELLADVEDIRHEVLSPLLPPFSSSRQPVQSHAHSRCQLRVQAGTLAGAPQQSGLRNLGEAWDALVFEHLLAQIGQCAPLRLPVGRDSEEWVVAADQANRHSHIRQLRVVRDRVFGCAAHIHVQRTECTIEHEQPQAAVHGGGHDLCRHRHVDRARGSQAGAVNDHKACGATRELLQALQAGLGVQAEARGALPIVNHGDVQRQSPSVGRGQRGGLRPHIPDLAVEEEHCPSGGAGRLVDAISQAAGQCLTIIPETPHVQVAEVLHVPILVVDRQPLRHSLDVPCELRRSHALFIGDVRRSVAAAASRQRRMLVAKCSDHI
mmetsp:Transcript_22973/g.78227  ORF Transcript_22973/g.78227 Transcript_22973/m.78227 type:complete len:363 (-) Transcript_22973:935-2023(-)